MATGMTPDQQQACRAFLREMFLLYPPGSWEGEDLQELGERTGVLNVVTATSPCGEDCACEELEPVTPENPSRCYRLAAWLVDTPNPETTA